MKTLVLGLGNPLLGDDGIGLRVADQVRQRLALSPAPLPPGSPAPLPSGSPALDSEAGLEIDTLSVGGLHLMERLAGYDRAILVDAICTGAHPPGTLLHLGPDDAPTQHTASSHDVNLPTALKLAQAMNIKMPEEIRIVAVEAENVLDFNDHCSPAVEAALPRAVEAVVRGLETGDWRLETGRGNRQSQVSSLSSRKEVA